MEGCERLTVGELSPGHTLVWPPVVVQVTEVRILQEDGRDTGMVRVFGRIGRRSESWTLDAGDTCEVIR